MTFKNYESLSRHLETLKKKSVPTALPSFQSFIGREPPPGNPTARDSDLIEQRLHDEAPRYGKTGLPNIAY